MHPSDLAPLGLRNIPRIEHNPSFASLVAAETAESLSGFEKGVLTDTGAVNVMTGVYTGRSPKDKFIVKDDVTRDTFWWTSEAYPNDNKPLAPEAWRTLKRLAQDSLEGKPLYVVDAFCGADPLTRLKVRFVMEVAWQAHFVTNMFIRPSAEELAAFGEPDFTVLAASKTAVEDYAALGLRTPTAIVFNFTERMQLIFNTWYGGEMKKGMFSVMNYLNPLRGIPSMHCSANTDLAGKNTALFFGLSGTGKTTLSTDPKRLLIGDDEHGWDDEGVFNYEGGCYAKVIHLDADKEPGIYKAIRPNALLENVIVDENGRPDYDDASATENTRVSYPIDHIDLIVKPVSRGPAPKVIIMLTADATGVLPPVSLLTREQAEYYFLTGYTSKVAGTEIGVTDPVPTFSACFGEAFLSLHPLQYAEVLGSRADAAGARFYLVNTGWNGRGERVSLKDTRAMIDAILAGELPEAPMKTLPVFGLAFPAGLAGVDAAVLDPRSSFATPEAWQAKAEALAGAFVRHFERFLANEGCRKLVAAGPQP
ncbi:MAG: phosphoenolpyruvate carboxykinase (ATP) [Duodenibacillus sp.]|nr:phosphoenolpyruvate carboxykinase (ATP) [Duodenibacillus sp.]